MRNLPDILSQNEIARILNAIHKPHYAVFLYTVYTMGLRLGEALALEVGDIDGEKLRVHIRNGKGHKDRFVPLAPCTYRILQQFWLTHRYPVLGADPKWLGAKIGMTGVLHTHTRRLDYHPHIHFIVPGGGIQNTGQHTSWRSGEGNFYSMAVRWQRCFAASSCTS